jgi:glyoxylase-like metal-dependent hydrolase (beta-lactamase superfamily II)
MAELIVKQFLVSQMVVFAYLVGSASSGEAAVIDPAADADRIIEEAKRRGLRITKIINTHGHVDHIMGNAEMKDKTGASIIMHEADASWMCKQSPNMFEMFGGRPSPPADQTVRDGDEIIVGDISLEVIHTPGHTVGGICLRIPDAVFTGDTLFAGGVGRTDLPGASWPTLLRSIKERLFSLPAETVVYPGHDYGPTPTTTIATERDTNPFL